MLTYNQRKQFLYVRNLQDKIAELEQRLRKHYSKSVSSLIKKYKSEVTRISNKITSVNN